MNPLYPPVLGDYETGGHPQTPVKGASPLCTPHFSYTIMDTTTLSYTTQKAGNSILNPQP